MLFGQRYTSYCGKKVLKILPKFTKDLRIAGVTLPHIQFIFRIKQLVGKHVKDKI